MISPNTFKNEAYKVSELFEELELKLLKKISRQLNQGKDLSVQDWKIQKLLDLELFTNNQKQIISEAKKINKEMGLVLEDAFKKGINESDATAQELKALGSVQNKVGTSIQFFKTNINNIAPLFQSSSTAVLNGVIATFSDATNKYYDSVIRASSGVLSGTETLNESIKSITQEMADKGIGEIRYSNGSKMSVSSYMEMATRTTCNKASQISTALRNKEYGYELCKVSEYSGSSPTCAPWQGQIYFDDTFGGQNNTEYQSLSEAINNGLFHPNCRHHKFPYDPEVQDYEPRVERDTQLYEKEQQQRYNERMIRKWKKRDAVASDKQTKLYTKSKVKEWQSKNRELVASDSRLVREYTREQLGD